MIVIGITGPTGAGKTTALSQIEKLGGTVVDCDAVYHELLKSNTALQDELCNRFGAIKAADGTIDRKALGRVVFGDAKALADLDAIIKPFVTSAVEAALAAAEEQGKRLAAVDGITIIESGLAARCDATVAVLAPVEDRIRRICAREDIGEEYARSRVAAQKEDEFFRANCGYVLFNDCAGTEEFADRAKRFFEQILTQYETGGTR
ncbi:MAG: dephospho-CoA kinase [Oscillospiraceae bacterium]|nr:dephospho-CoA kinase [Oscillospiraceae bacterium]